MADELKAPPRNYLLGLLADALGGVGQYAEKRDYQGNTLNPPLNAIVGLLGIPGAARTVDRLSYGEPITNAGKGSYRPMIPQDTVDAAGLLGIASKPLARGALNASDAAVRAIAQNPRANSMNAIAAAGQLRPAVGLTEQQSRAERMAAMGLEDGWFRGGAAPVDNKRTGPWYTRDADEAAAYAKRSGGEVREYAIPSGGYLDASRGYSSKLAHDIAAILDDPYYGKQGSQLAKELRTFGPGEGISGGSVWQALESRYGNDGAAEVLTKLGAFKGVKGIAGPDEAYVFKNGAVRDAKRAAFDLSRYNVDDITAGLAGVGLLGGSAVLASRDSD